MTEAAPPPVPTFSCPGCKRRLTAHDGAFTCDGCATAGTVHGFQPQVAAATLVVGEGRCANHPGKDAVEACERCGAFACEVCVTRTGEHVLCAACFDVLHERGELETTVHSRVRWDRLASMSLLLLLLCWPVGIPACIVVPCYALWRRRTAPYLSATGPIVVLVLGVLIALGAIAALVVGRMS